MTKVIPAIIPESFSDVQSKAEQVVNFVDRVQVDVADGMFAPVTTWPLNEEGYLENPDINTTFPYLDQLQYEIHLMTQDPEEYIQEWIRLGVTSLIFHSSMLEAPHQLKRYLKEQNIEFGIAITPTEYDDVSTELLKLADFVQVMGSDRIGYHGVELQERALAIIEHLSHHLNCDIAVDIGVNLETAPILKKAGADRLVSGSAIFGARDIEQAIRQLGN